MSYTVEQPSGSRSRPATVTVSVVLLYAAAALAAVHGVLGVVSYYVSDFTFASTDPNVPTEITQASSVLGVIVSAVFYTLLTAGFVTLAVLVGKGKNPARVVTWVVAGIVVLCCGCSTLATAVFPSMLSSINDQAAQNQINELAGATPGWLQVLTAVASVAMVVDLIVVIVLLMLPASNEFFRRELEVWVPPTWPAVTDPAYPPYPAPPPVISESAFPPPPSAQPQYPPPPVQPPYPPPPAPQYPPPPPADPYRPPPPADPYRPPSSPPD